MHDSQCAVKFLYWVVPQWITVATTVTPSMTKTWFQTWLKQNDKQINKQQWVGKEMAFLSRMCLTTLYKNQECLISHIYNKNPFRTQWALN